MGLSQVYGFIQQSQGDLEIDTLVGKGTTVSLYLPVFVSANDEPSNEELDAKDLGPLDKVLVVDDQPDVLSMSSELFSILGYKVLTGNNGFEEGDILNRTSDLAVLFTDVMMPGMTGELARKVRELIPSLRVLLVSGYAALALQEKNGDLAEFELLQKP